MPAINPHILWIFALIVGAILVMGGLTSVFNIMGRGWRTLASEFPPEQVQEADAARERSFIYIIAPGEDPGFNRGCLLFFMPWRWKLAIPVRYASGIERLDIVVDGGKIGVSGGVSIPWYEMEVVSVGQMGVGWTLGKAKFGETATVRAGSCMIVLPMAQFRREVEMLAEQAGKPLGDSNDDRPRIA
jgi:uncharacterized membrane protein